MKTKKMETTKLPISEMRLEFRKKEIKYENDLALLGMMNKELRAENKVLGDERNEQREAIKIWRSDNYQLDRENKRAVKRARGILRLIENLNDNYDNEEIECFLVELNKIMVVEK